MHEPTLYALPPGVDFPAALVKGLELRFRSQPEDLARVTLVLNTRRMARRVRHIFDAGPPRLLPRIVLLSQLESLVPGTVPEPLPGLRRRLELAKLVAGLQDERPEFAARAATFDLADSLATLMDEMQGEGVSPGTISGLDVSDHSEHFAQTQAFLGIVETYLAATRDTPDTEARQRLITQTLVDGWAESPPEHPIVLAGSTASRGTTRILAEAIARLEQGFVVLPGFDLCMPHNVWEQLDDKATGLPVEDHPQFRFHNLMQRLGISPDKIARWANEAPHSEARNRLVSLALRPAPVTDAWRAEGPSLGDLQEATQDLTLVEADSPRAEALAIALRLRQAAEDGQKAALITPDRMLTRQVSAALDAWHIIPDDSAGMPLHLSPVGRFLRHAAELLARPLTAESLLTLLKHPITNSTDDRNLHQLNTQRLELVMRDLGVPFPDHEALKPVRTKLKARYGDPILEWLDWVETAFAGLHAKEDRPLAEMAKAHLAAAEAIAGEPGSGLWTNNDGEAARKVFDSLLENAEHGDPLDPVAYQSLFHSLLSREEVRNSVTPHPGIMIWGTLEARVQGADLVILGSLNDGTWPEQPKPDPWLNRSLRHQAGLLLPDRRIGLSAHDFQQAIAAKEVWLTRAVRSSEAETVPSRWLNRLANLMSGLETGKTAWDDMRARGREWTEKARAYETVIESPRSKRPSPRPPVAARPRVLSVTELKTLVRDPYVIYAKYVLRLRPLGPIVPQADALLRGIAIHQVVEDFIKSAVADPDQLTVERLGVMAQKELVRVVPWLAERALWQARVDRVAEWFVEGEAERQKVARPTIFEAKGSLELPDIGMIVTARADRIDTTADGAVVLYDYKTGTPPSENIQKKFDRQLLVEAAMVEQGGFSGLDPASVAGAHYIGLGSSPKIQNAPLSDEPPEKVIAELRALLAAYLRDQQGYTSRRAHLKDSDTTDYDQLARYGEWEPSEDAVPEVVK